MNYSYPFCTFLDFGHQKRWLVARKQKGRSYPYCEERNDIIVACFLLPKWDFPVASNHVNAAVVRDGPTMIQSEPFFWGFFFKWPLCFFFGFVFGPPCVFVDENGLRLFPSCSFH